MRKKKVEVDSSDGDSISDGGNPDKVATVGMTKGKDKEEN